MAFFSNSSVTPKRKSLKKMLYLGCLVGFGIYNIFEAREKLNHNVNNDETFNTVKIIGDTLQVLIPIIALIIPIIKNDEQAQKAFIKSLVVTFLITHALKHGFNATRPNGGNRSFPSGHTSSAFQGAGFIHQKYGLTSAIPAYIGASFVGFSRVYTKKHHTIDVIAGAVIGTVVSKYFS